MRPSGSPLQLERRRQRAIALLEHGWLPGKVATRVGVDRRSVRRWNAAYRRRGEAGILAKPVPGRPLKLRPRQQRRLVEVLGDGAHAAGYATDYWTRSRIVAVIRRRFGVRYHVDHIGRLLQNLGWSPGHQRQRRRHGEQAA